MVALREKFGTLVGYSDHTVGVAGGADDPLNGITVPLGAVALGGCMIEKHVTDDRARKGPDHPFALTMEEFATMVSGIRAMEQALGDGRKRLMPSESETVVIQRRSAYAVASIEKGEKLTRAKLEYLRPAVSVRPAEIKKILGKKAKRAIAAGEPLTILDFA
jgi:sialic acid synthase SpsE